MTPVRLIGIGSPHGADAAGWRAVAALERGGLVQRFPAGLLSLDNCAAPVDLYRLLAGCRFAVLIDALPCEGRRPRAVDPQALRRRCGEASVHGIGVPDMLDLLAALADPPPRVLLLGLPVGEAAGAQMLEARLTGLVPALSRAVAAAIERFLGRHDARSHEGGALPRR